eukprot:SAG22_NODE_283_length_13027_cov_25.568535_5_plen_248_part_00
MKSGRTERLCPVPVTMADNKRLCPVPVTMADINYFLEIEPECVKFILNLLGYEEVGCAACVCREFYKELTPRAKTIAHTIQCVEKITKYVGWDPAKKWGDPALTSLTKLDLRNNYITDIAPLSALTSLTTLYLHNNQIADLAPLSALTSLTDLYLRANQITDIAPLSSLTWLTKLDLHGNQITDLAPLSAMTSLTWLSLYKNQITDIAPLKSLTSLRILDLQNNPGKFSDSDETVVLLKSRGCKVFL